MPYDTILHVAWKRYPLYFGWLLDQTNGAKWSTKWLLKWNYFSKYLLWHAQCMILISYIVCYRYIIMSNTHGVNYCPKYNSMPTPCPFWCMTLTHMPAQRVSFFLCANNDFWFLQLKETAKLFRINPTEKRWEQLQRQYIAPNHAHVPGIF